MKYIKKLTLGMVALNAVCAIIWGILTIMDIAARNEIQILIMHAFCAASFLHLVMSMQKRQKWNGIQTVTWIRLITKAKYGYQ